MTHTDKFNIGISDEVKYSVKVGVTKYTKVPLEKSDQFQKMAFYVLIRRSLYLQFYLEK